MVGKEGVEPSQPCGHRILSPACMPFHHLPNESKIYGTQWHKFLDELGFSEAQTCKLLSEGEPKAWSLEILLRSTAFALSFAELSFTLS